MTASSLPQHQWRLLNALYRRPRHAWRTADKLLSRFDLTPGDLVELSERRLIEASRDRPLGGWQDLATAPRGLYPELVVGLTPDGSRWVGQDRCNQLLWYVAETGQRTVDLAKAVQNSDCGYDAAVLCAEFGLRVLLAWGGAPDLSVTRELVKRVQESGVTASITSKGRAIATA